VTSSLQPRWRARPRCPATRPQPACARPGPEPSTGVRANITKPVTRVPLRDSFALGPASEVVVTGPLGSHSHRFHRDPGPTPSLLAQLTTSSRSAIPIHERSASRRMTACLRPLCRHWRAAKRRCRTVPPRPGGCRASPELAIASARAGCAVPSGSGPRTSLHRRHRAGLWSPVASVGMGPFLVGGDKKSPRMGTSRASARLASLLRPPEASCQRSTPTSGNSPR
jgi:hypothetical protein